MTTADATTTYGTGLHEVHVSDPEAAALDIAEALGAELVAGPDELDDAVRARESERVAVDPAALRELRTLAADLEKAERIRARTEAKIAGALGEQMTTSTGLAIHPAAIRAAAEAVLAARDVLAAAEAAAAAPEVVEPDPEAEATAARTPRHATRPTVFAFDSAPVVRRIVITMILTVIVVGGLLALGLVPIYVAAIVPLIGLWSAYRKYHEEEDDAQGTHDAGSHLASVGAATDELFGRRLAAEPTSRHQALVNIQRDGALEQLRVAERQWRDLAGPGAEPDDVEAVLIRHDPQLHRAEVWASESAAVRTAAAVHRRIRARWRVAWAALDRDPPSSADARATIETLASDGDAPADRRPLVVAGSALDRAAEDGTRSRLVRLGASVPVILVGPDATRPSQWGRASS
jgi:hypothetical protein